VSRVLLLCSNILNSINPFVDEFEFNMPNVQFAGGHSYMKMHQMHTLADKFSLVPKDKEDKKDKEDTEEDPEEL
jgi:hypothetical protein